MKKLIRGVCTFAAAVALIAAPLAAGSAAVADEVTDPAVVQTVDETAPATETTQAPAEVVDAPVVPEPEVVPTTPAEKPTQEPVDTAVQTTDAQPQAPPVAAKTKPEDHKVTICHVPPGNPENAQTIEVDANGWNGHKNHKGDYEGACAPKFEVKEVCATWEVDKGNDLWPQTLLSKDCNYVPEQRCEAYKIQFDKYWIRDAADQAYYDSLTKLNSAADDQSLEPHGYYVKTIAAKDCRPKAPNPIANGEVVCGSATFNLYNPPRVPGDTNLTASLVFWIDGKVAPEHIYAVASGETKTVTVTFPEDSGNHSIFVRTGYAQGDEYVWDQVVTTDCIVAQPEPKIEYTEWVDGEFECTATEVPQTRTKSVTTYELVGKEWVAQEPVITTENQTRPLTDEEQEAADIECAGPQPENKVTHTEWVTGEYACGDTTVQITRTETVTEYVREGAEWVEGKSVDNFQTETRALTENEIAELNCPVVVPPTATPTPKPTTPPAPETGNLAATGADGGAIIGWSLLAFGAIAGAIALIVTGRRKAQAIPVKSETDED